MPQNIEIHCFCYIYNPDFYHYSTYVQYKGPSGSCGIWFTFGKKTFSCEKNSYFVADVVYEEMHFFRAANSSLEPFVFIFIGKLIQILISILSLLIVKFIPWFTV